MNATERLVTEAAALVGSLGTLKPEVEAALALMKSRDGEIDSLIARLRAAAETAELGKKLYLSEREAVNLGYFSSLHEARRMRREKVGPAYVQEAEGCRVRYPVRNLEEWMERNKVLTRDALRRRGVER